MSNLHFLQPRVKGPERLICLHSSGATSRQWDAYRATLGQRYELHTPELIGYAGTTRWPTGKPASLDDEARQLPALLGLDGAHLFGHSYGGAVALQVALRWPERVKSLTLYEPVRFNLLMQHADTLGTGETIIGVGRRIGLQVLSGRLHAAAADFVDYWSGSGSWQRLHSARQDALAARMPKVQAEFEALFADRVPAAAYNELRMPVTLIGGTRSPLPARQVQELLARELPNCRSLRLQGLGHMGPVQDPRRVLSAIDACSGAAPWPQAA